MIHTIPQPEKTFNKRVILVGAFRNRLTRQERIAIQTATDDEGNPDLEVQDLLESLKYAPQGLVRLDLPELVSDVKLLIAKGLIDASKEEVLLADAQPHEVPR